MELLDNEQDPQLYFTVGGGFSCRIIPGTSEEKLADLIDNLHYESAWCPTSTMGEEYWAELAREAERGLADRDFFYDGSDVTGEIYEMLRKQYGSGNQEGSPEQAYSQANMLRLQHGADRYAASWLLARLWQLTAGGIRNAIASLGQDNQGFGDGGGYNIYLLVEKEGQPVAVLWLEGTADYITLEIRQRAESLGGKEQERIYRSFAQSLLHAQEKIAVCKIIIKDPEQEAFPFPYGWDGTEFLCCTPEDVLYWLEKKRKKGELIRKAMVKVEAHPLHHLERGLREAICHELSLYIRLYQTENLLNTAFRLKLELDIMTRAAQIWQDTWWEESNLSLALTKCRELVYEENSVKRRIIMEELENIWSILRDFMEHTTIRDMKHRTHKFPASLAGYCIMQGAYFLHYEMERYMEVIEKWKTLGRDVEASSPEALHKRQKEIEELVNEQDNRKHSQDSWGRTGDTDTAEDFYREDMYFYAACTFADGLPYEMEGFETGKPEKFREFWNRWLYEALIL